MPSIQLLYYLLFGVALFVGGGAVMHNFTASPRSVDQAQKPSPVSPPAKPAEKTERASAPDQKKAPPVSLPAAAAPTFDVVRIETDGAGVIAGRAEPGWTVMIESRGDEIAQAVADRNGQWAIVLDRPLPPGEHSIGLRSMSPQKTRGLVSEQQVAISLAKSKAEGKTVVALSEPGKPTRVLTPKEPRIPPAELAKPMSPPETAAPAPDTSPAGAVETARLPDAAPSETTPSAKADKPPALPESAQAKAAPSRLPEKVVAFDAVDYEVGAKGEGKLFLSGQAEPGMRIRLYLDNSRVGDAVAGADGLWTFEGLRTLRPEEPHTMRADAVQPDGQVASRAEVPFTPPVQPSAPVVAEAAPKPPAAAMVEKEPAAVAAATPPPAAVQEKAEERQVAAAVPARQPKPVTPAPQAAPAQPPADAGAQAEAPPMAAPPAQTQSEPDKQEPPVAAAPAQPSMPKQEKVAEPQVAAAPAQPQPAEKARPKAPAAAALVPSPSPEKEKVEERQMAAAPAQPKPETRMRAFQTPATPAQPRANEARPAEAPPMATAAEVKDPLLQEQEKQAPAPGAAAQVATATPEQSAQPSATKRAILPNQKRSILVRKGDTLWHIAERRYGHGWRYTVIYRSNRRQIRNPHWIYPGQEFRLPNR